MKELRANYLNDKIILIIGLISLALHITAVLCSEGFHHCDEHFQIISYASYKLGDLKVTDLTWEYESRIRPGLQPMLAYSIMAPLKGVLSQYGIILITRLIAFLLSFFVTLKFTSVLIRQYSFSESGKKLLLILTLCLWYLPYLHVRFSSETLSMVFIMIGLTSLNMFQGKLSLKHLALGGFAFGLAFQFRYQIAFFLLGLFLWMILIKKAQLKEYLYLGIGFVAALFIGLLADYWLYGEWVFTPYNYFYSNIVENKAANYGTQPWWAYVHGIFHKSFLPLGILTITGVLFLIWKKSKSLILWMLIPFLLVHFAIGHKELRFLFPAVIFVPFIIISLLDNWKSLTSKFYMPILLVFLILNIPLAIISSSRPAYSGLKSYRIAQELYGSNHYVIRPMPVKFLDLHLEPMYYHKPGHYRNVDDQKLIDLPPKSIVITNSSIPDEFIEKHNLEFYKGTYSGFHSSLSKLKWLRYDPETKIYIKKSDITE